MQNWLEHACAVSGLTAHDIAQYLSQSDAYFEERLRHPGTLTLNELFALSTLFNEDGKQILWEAVSELRP